MILTYTVYKTQQKLWQNTKALNYKVLSYPQYSGPEERNSEKLRDGLELLSSRWEPELRLGPGSELLFTLMLTATFCQGHQSMNASSEMCTKCLKCRSQRANR